jgi:hypothetical protein
MGPKRGFNPETRTDSSIDLRFEHVPFIRVLIDSVPMVMKSDKEYRGCLVDSASRPGN